MVRRKNIHMRKRLLFYRVDSETVEIVAIIRQQGASKLFLGKLAKKVALFLITIIGLVPIIAIHKKETKLCQTP